MTGIRRLLAAAKIAVLFGLATGLVLGVSITILTGGGDPPGGTLYHLVGNFVYWAKIGVGIGSVFAGSLALAGGGRPGSAIAAQRGVGWGMCAGSVVFLALRFGLMPEAFGGGVMQSLIFPEGVLALVGAVIGASLFSIARRGALPAAEPIPESLAP